MAVSLRILMSCTLETPLENACRDSDGVETAEHYPAEQPRIERPERNGGETQDQKKAQVV
ncbi:MAG: hypothetical protein K2X99_01640 [Gemmatimonadaceae bacterium]|nr:hypothetical protein [Gemmatimonadaceae bacterium]